MSTTVYTKDQKSRLLEQVNNLTSLQAAPTPPPTIAPGTVALFCDPSWSARRLELNINDYVAGRRQRLPSNMFDNADWVAWNLPLGTVMTFTDAVTDATGRTNIADLSYAMGTFDLVGSGITRGGTLAKNWMADKASMFFWREIDLWQGALELFQATQFDGNFTTIFLSEWPRDTIVNCEKWALNDTISSIRWKTLTDRQTAVLFSNGDGSGAARYDNIKGWGSFKEVANLTEYGFNDNMGGFSWASASPRKEIIAPVQISPSEGISSTSLTAFNRGDNRTDLPQKTTVTLNVEEAQSMTIETSDQHHVGISAKVSQTVKGGVEGVASTETTVEFGFTYDFTTTKTVTRTTTKTIAVNIVQEFNVPAQKHFEASVIASIGTLPPTDYETKATRWYDYPVIGGTKDSSNNNWYKREENVVFRIGGSLMSKTSWSMRATDF